jgi:excinuclease ABC subunit B
MDRALAEMDRRRVKQLAYNKEHKITPKTIVKAVEQLEEFQSEAKAQALAVLRETEAPIRAKDIPLVAEELEKRMKDAADNLDFELAAALRDQLFEIKQMTVGGSGKSAARNRPAKARGR